MPVRGGSTITHDRPASRGDARDERFDRLMHRVDSRRRRRAFAREIGGRERSPSTAVTARRATTAAATANSPTPA